MHPERPDQDAPLAALLQQTLAVDHGEVVDALERRIMLRPVNHTEKNRRLLVVVPELSQNGASERPNVVFVNHNTFLVGNRVILKLKTP